MVAMFDEDDHDDGNEDDHHDDNEDDHHDGNEDDHHDYIKAVMQLYYHNHHILCLILSLYISVARFNKSIVCFVPPFFKFKLFVIAFFKNLMAFSYF